MDEKPPKETYIDQPHYDSGDYSWPPRWYRGLTKAAGASLSKNSEEPKTIRKEEEPE